MKNVFRTFAAIMISAGIAQASSWCSDHSMPAIFSVETNYANASIAGNAITGIPADFSSVNGFLIVKITSNAIVKRNGQDYMGAMVTSPAYFYLPLTYPWSDALISMAIKGAAEQRLVTIQACEFAYNSSLFAGPFQEAGPYPGVFVIERMSIMK